MNGNPDSQSFQIILLEHARRYPAWQMEDLYKLIHQANLGSEHAVTDREHARRWLEEELAHLQPTQPEPLIDPISPDGSIVRVHLQPFAAGGLSSALLLDAFIQTSAGFRGSIRGLEDAWREATSLAEGGLLHFDPAKMESFITEKSRQGYPAVHHSERYTLAYHPAYRVTARVYLPVEW